MIDQKNWTHCFYEAGEFSASISTGGELDHHNQYLELFFLNKFKGEELLYQESYASILLACDEINSNYGHWTFKDKLTSENSSGCSTCQAH